MLLSSPVRGTIRPDARFYEDHPDAAFRSSGNRDPLVTHDFGPSTVTVEPTVEWPGGEMTILGTVIPARTYKNFHRGIDISDGGCGKDILAAAPGTVTASHKDGTDAEVIVIDHGKIGGHRYETGYIHLAKRLVFVRNPPVVVAAGAVIGTLGDTGRLSTGCHLHFYLKKDGRFVDPWRRLLQNTSIDPDASAPAEVRDVPIPASNNEYVAGQVAVIGNAALGARVRTAPRTGATLVRTVPGGSEETWLPTCWVVGEATLDSDRWLTRWNDGQWEFTHFENVRSVTPL
jgi:murein DD-endopeptidase MepM/ murein hydrolase activator NlpD